MKTLLCLVFLLTFIYACKPESESISHNFALGDTVVIRFSQTLKNPDNNISIRMDSVVNDSRCPIPMECFWAGIAEVRFIFKSENQETKFNLNTTTHRDTVLNGYKITLIDLLPYPVANRKLSQSEYYAKITAK